MRQGWAVLGIVFALFTPLSAQVGTGFTYQGRLQVSGSPASGPHDLQLRLYDEVTDGLQVGPTLTLDDVVVTNGVFSVVLDFGPAFLGSRRWLEIGVRPGASAGEYTLLSPRQEVTPAPHAGFAEVTPWSGVSDKPEGFADDVDDDSGGDVTGVIAGAGLTGGGTNGDVTLHVNLQGNGIAPFAARSDHNHTGQTWVVDLPFEPAFRAMNTGTGGFSDGLWGQSDATNQGRGVVGYATAASGNNFGVWAQTDSVAGRGVYGLATAATGVNYGVYGETASPNGFAGFFQGPVQVNGPIWFGSSTNLRVNQSAFSIFGFHHEGSQVIMGHTGNSIVGQGTIAGGGEIIDGVPYFNRVVQQGGTIGGGINNRAGWQSGDPGGANAFYATVAGGVNNIARGVQSFVGGGDSNIAAGGWSVVAGGRFNETLGAFGFAAGQRAKSSHSGAFVWSDGQAADFASTGNDQFLIRAQGGVGINTNAPGAFALAVNGDAAKPGGGSWSVLSDARLKRDVEPLRDSLGRLLALQGVSFEYEEPERLNELTGRRIGMIAQQVETVFPDWVGRGADGYRYLTYRGFEALAVEALRDLRVEKDREIAALCEELAALREAVSALRNTVDAGRR